MQHGFNVVSLPSDSPLSLQSDAAASADVVFLCVGGILGHEGLDRVNITLPPPQPALVEAAIAAAGPKLVLVLVNGEPVAIDEYVGRIDTIVEALEGGQSAGTALAEIVLGEVSPSGVLPFTMYPASFVDERRMDNYDMRGDSATPGLTYRFYRDTPVFEFGHGLSYVGWDIKWGTGMPAASATAATLRRGLALPVTVTNTGNLPGSAVGQFAGAAKVVQLFLKVLVGHDSPPLKTLVAMEKVMVEKGESAHVTLNTSAVAGTCAFCVVDAAGESSIKAGNRYQLSVASEVFTVTASA